MNRFIKRLKGNEGGISLALALSIPVILLIMFLMIDFIQYSYQKSETQRKLDSATVGVAIEALPDGDVVIDSDGYIVEGDRAGQKACAITNEMYQKGFDQLARDINATDYEVKNISTPEQMENGIARMQVLAYTEHLIANYLLPFNWRLPYVVESYAVCTIGEGDYTIIDPPEYNITYVLNGGQFNEEPVRTYTPRDEVVLTDNVSYEGYEFKGWYETPDFSSSQITIIPIGSTGDKTFYAKWEKKVNKVNVVVSYISESGYKMGYDNYVVNAGQTVTFPAKTFNGYYQPGDLTTYIPEDQQGILYLNIYYSLIHYDINYVLDGGQIEANAPSSYTIEDEVVLPDPVKINCSFIGWSLEFHYGTVESNTISKGNYSNVSAKAKWQDNEPPTYLYYARTDLSDNVLRISSIPYDEVEYKDTGAFIGEYEEVDVYYYGDKRPWASNKDNITKVVIDEYIEPKSIDWWFADLRNVVSYEGLDLIDVSNLTSLNGVFKNNVSFTGELNLRGWDTSNVTSIEDIFYGLGQNGSEVNILVDNWDVSKVTYMGDAFYNAGYNSTTFKTDLSNWDTGNCTNFGNMFAYTGYNSSNWSVGDLSSWDLSKAEYTSNMFYAAGTVTSDWSVGDLRNWDMSNVKNTEFMFSNSGKNSTEWSLGDIKDWNLSKVISMDSMFMYAGKNSNKFNIDLSNWILSATNNMSNMFYGAGQNATDWSIGDISNWNVSNVTNTSYMFAFSGQATPNWNIGTLSAWNTKNLENMSSMFYQAGSNSENFILNLSTWDVSRVENMYYSFCSAGNRAKVFDLGNLDNWNTNQTINMSHMFDHAGENAADWNIGDISNWDVRNVFTMEAMFYYAGAGTSNWNIGNLKNWKTYNVTNMSMMFSYAGRRSSVFELDLSNWSVGKVTTTKGMFAYAGQNADSWTVGNISDWNTSNVTDMSMMFHAAGYSATNFAIDLSNWNVSKVTNMASMFDNSGFYSRSWTVGDLDKWNTLYVTDMSYMFYKTGYNASSWNAGSLADWQTIRVKYMNNMFDSCAYYASNWNIGDLSNWNVANVIDTTRMFADSGFYASSWTVGLLNNWNTESLMSIKEMFFGAGYYSQSFVLDLSGWNVSKITDFENLFSCAGYSASTWSVGHISKWDVSKATNLMGTFAFIGNGEDEIILDLSNWNTSNVRYTKGMFEGSEKIKTIYVSDLWSNAKVSSSDYMFNGCKSLVGGSGIVFDAAKANISMANYTDGYFTFKSPD